jgi:hypothetical protein
MTTPAPRILMTSVGMRMGAGLVDVLERVCGAVEYTYALVNVTHKLARIVWRMLTDNRPFRARAPRRAKRA